MFGTKNTKDVIFEFKRLSNNGAFKTCLGPDKGKNLFTHEIQGKINGTHSKKSCKAGQSQKT